MARRDAEINDYYDDLTRFINRESGLDEVSVDQVKMVCRLTKKIPNTQDDYDPSTDSLRAMRCTARRSDGQPCRKYKLAGAQVCRVHGGAAKQVRNAARIRLQNAAELMAKELLKMATDDNISDVVKLKAITEALDRGGISVKAEVEITAKPYEQISESISMSVGGSRAEYRRSRGVDDDTHALGGSVAALPAAIDAELVDDELDDDLDADSGSKALFVRDDLHGRDDRESGSPFDSAPPPGAMMPMDAAISAAAVMRTEAQRQRREQQLALPPGRSGR